MIRIKRGLLSKKLAVRYVTQWFMRDNFTIDRAAGAVNGTSAEPGPGLRTVTDTGGNVTLAGGKLLFAAGLGSPSLSDPRLDYTSSARDPGLVVVSKMDGYTGRSYIGFTNSIQRIISGAVTSTAVSVLTLAGGSLLSSTIQRASGTFYFYFTTVWLLGWIDSTVTGADYVSVLAYNGTNLSFDYIKVAQLNWLPAPLTSDGMGSAFGTSDGLGHLEQTGIGSGGAGKVWTGATWANAGGTASNTPTVGAELASGALVVGNWYSITASQVNYFYTGSAIGDTFRATATTALDANNKVKLITLATLFASTTHSTADVLATVAVTLTAGTQAGVVVNLDSAATPANFVIGYHDGTNCKLEKCVAGTYTSVVSAAATYSAGAEIRVIKDGTAYRLYYNNALVGTGTIADAGIVSQTLHGIFSTYSGNTIDYVNIYSRGTDGIYDAPLNEVANG